jgi:putative transposase
MMAANGGASRRSAPTAAEQAFYHHDKPRQGIANARQLRPLPPPITDPDQVAPLDIRRCQRLGGS